MKGMNAETGRSISGSSHLKQSVARIITTPLGSCLQRRSFGSTVPDLTDAPSNDVTRVRACAAIATALLRWEPRLTVTRVQFVEGNDDAAAGGADIDIEGWTSEQDELVSMRVRSTQRGAA